LKTTGVYFTAPAPVPNLPQLPGKIIQELSCPSPLMIGEFTGPDGSPYAMIVNLSLQDSAKFTLKTTDTKGAIRYMSPVDASWSDMEKDNTMWLPAGQGVLLKFP
jgi:hypothetical protein